MKWTIQHHNLEVVPWLGFYKREFLIDNNILFPLNISYEEDQIFVLRTLLIPNTSVLYSNDAFYNYRQNENSVTKKPNIKQCFDVIDVISLEKSLVKNSYIEKKTLKYAYKYISASFYQLTSIYGRLNKNDRKIVLQHIPFEIKTFCLRYPYDFHQWIKIFLFTYFRPVVDLFYKIRK